MNDIHLPKSNQAANLQGCGESSVTRRNAMHGDPRILRAASQQGILDGNQFGSVAARKQSLQEQQRLVLSSAVVPTKVDDERAHAQASPGFGH